MESYHPRYRECGRKGEVASLVLDWEAWDWVATKGRYLRHRVSFCSLEVVSGFVCMLKRMRGGSGTK